MNKILIIYFLTAAVTAHSQILEPVKWSVGVEKISDNEYVVTFNAAIDKNYHLYSLNVPDDGPLPTAFTFIPGKDYELMGSMEESKGQILYDPVYEMKIKCFTGKATFKQRIKVKSKDHIKIAGEIAYMSCNKKSCVPGYFDFELDI